MHHHHDNFWWRFFPKKELTQVYFAITIRAFAVSLVSLFIPLYLHVDQGFSLQETLTFFIFFSVMLALISPFAAKFCSHFGLKHSILVSAPLYIIFLLLLYFLPVLNTPLWVIAIFFGSSTAFFWMGMHVIFHHDTNSQHRAEAFGKRTGLSILANMGGPLLGGLLIKLFGFKIIFLLAAVLLFVGAGVMFLSKEDYVKYHFSVRGLLDKKHWNDPVFFISRGAHLIALGVIWPLFIYFILNDYLALGVVGFLLSGISALLVWSVGKFSDRIGRRRTIRWITGFESLSWFLRAMVNTPWHIFAITIFGAITYGLMESPLGALEYNNAHGNVINYFVNREIYLCIGRILMISFVLLIGSLGGGLILNGFTNLGVLFF